MSRSSLAVALFWIAITLLATVAFGAPDTTLNPVAVLVVDSQGQQVGRYCSSGTLCQHTPLGWMSPSVFANGIWAPHAMAFFTTTNCSGPAYIVSDLNGLAWQANDLAIPPNGGSVVYPDRTQIQTINAVADGLVAPDMSLLDCFALEHPVQEPGAPLIMGPYQTFYPPFHLH